MAIVDSNACGTTSTQEVRLVWHIRHQKDIQWIAPMLNLVAEQCTELPDFTVIVDCYVTRLPVDGQGNANERCSNSNLLDPENQEQPLLSTLAIGAGQSLLRYHVGRANIPAVVERALSKTSENQLSNGLSVAGKLRRSNAADFSVWPSWPAPRCPEGSPSFQALGNRDKSGVLRGDVGCMN